MTSRRKILGGFIGAALLPSIAQAARSDLVIDQVTVLPMTGSEPMKGATVVIKGGRIASIQQNTNASVAIAAKRVNGRGKYLIPGLTDAHTHLESDEVLKYYLTGLRLDLPTRPVLTKDAILPYLANGVLQICNLSATADGLVQRADISSGRILGPRIVAAAMIDGIPPGWPEGMTRVARNPDEGRSAVRKAAADGYELVKVYGSLSLETFTAIVAEAKRLSVPVVGHIPGRGENITEKFFQPGFGMVAHAEEFAQQTATPDITAIPRYLEMAKRSGTGLITTLSLDERLLEQVRDPNTLMTRRELAYLNPIARKITLEHNPYVARRSPGFINHLERVVEFNKALVKQFSDAGVPILAGTDTGVPGMVAGFSLHDELSALVSAGLSNQQALVAATVEPGRWLNNGSGTIAPGQRADLLLLDSDPTLDIANCRKMCGIVLGGRFIEKKELDRQMERVKVASQ